MEGIFRTILRMHFRPFLVSTMIAARSAQSTSSAVSVPPRHTRHHATPQDPSGFGEQVGQDKGLFRVFACFAHLEVADLVTLFHAYIYYILWSASRMSRNKGCVCGVARRGDGRVGVSCIVGATLEASENMVEGVLG